MRSARAAQAALFCLLCTGAGIAARAASLPHLRLAHGTAQLILHGRPFLIRGGELENSTAGTASAASTVLPALARRQFNTVLMQVAWDEIEPVEGRFDFSILNHWIAVARRRLPWRLAAHFKPAGRSWPGVFGPRADEAFMAWYYARYVNAVARAGPRQDSLPMYMNAQLPAAHQRAGEYPSGGPYPRCQPIYRAGAPAITFYAPDIGTNTEASDPAGMSHLRNVRARQPRRCCVRSEAGCPAARMRVVLSLAPVRGPGYNVSRTNDVPTAERAGSDARGVACAAEAAERATVHSLQRRPTMNREPAQRSAQAARPARTETRQVLSGTA